MSGVMFRFLFKRHRLTMSLLGLLPLIIGIAIGLLYPTYSKERQVLKVMKFTTRFFGGDQLDMFSADGAFSLPYQHPLVFIAYAVIGAVPALAIPAGDRGTKALDLMLATPLTRLKLLRTVWVFQLLGAFYLAGMAYVSAALAGKLAGEFELINHMGFFSLTILSFGLISSFSAIALVISVQARERSQATLFYGITVTLFFLLDVFARMWKDGEWLQYLTPYGYMRPARVLSQPQAFTGSVIRDILVVFSVGLLGQFVAQLLHKRRRSA